MMRKTLTALGEEPLKAGTARAIRQSYLVIVVRMLPDGKVHYAELLWPVIAKSQLQDFNTRRTRTDPPPAFSHNTIIATRIVLCVLALDLIRRGDRPSVMQVPSFAIRNRGTATRRAYALQLQPHPRLSLTSAILT